MTDSTQESEGRRRSLSDRQIALLIFALVLSLYLRTLAPGLLAGDPGEFQFAAWNWGLSHPTGYPLYMLFGGMWQRPWALIGISPATSLNAFSAIVGAASVAMLYILMVNWLSGSLTRRRLGALLSSTLLAVNPTFWNQSLIAEVYSLHVLFMVLILWAAQRVEQIRKEEKNLGEESDRQIPSSPSFFRASLLLIFLLGLSLAHHAMTLLLIPGVVAFLVLQWTSRQKTRDGNERRTLPYLFAVTSICLLILPLIFYLYIPLRSGPEASPWYHQELGSEVLTLYDGSFEAFIDFVTGRSISVGFRDVGDALAQIPFAADQWRIHFTWIGLLIIVAGVVVLVQQQRWSVLLLTAIYALLQQGFNLFYNIGDIYVYYVPLYLIGAIWAGFGIVTLSTGFGRIEETSQEERPSMGKVISIFILLIPLLIPLRLSQAYQPQIDQSENRSTRLAWEAILDANPPEDAILISNDRNEIVPLFYLQYVEERESGLSGLFPLIAPEDRFADIVSTIEVAVEQGAGRPVYLIKPMPGLEVKFALEEKTPPLVQVVGGAATSTPDFALDREFGSLTLLGYDWIEDDGETDITLYWRVNEPIDRAYTTTVQLYDAAQQRIAQDDRVPGGDFYNTAFWKPGEILLDRHILTMSADQQPTDMLIGMYHGPEFDMLAPPLEIELPRDR